MKFLSNSSFQDLMVLCCRKWWKHSWWYWYFPIVLNICNLARNIISLSCMWYSHSWECASNFYFFIFFINVHFYHCWILWANYKLHVSFYQVFKCEISLPAPGKINHMEIKIFWPACVGKKLFSDWMPTENKNYLIPLPIFFSFTYLRSEGVYFSNEMC